MPFPESISCRIVEGVGLPELHWQRDGGELADFWLSCPCCTSKLVMTARGREHRTTFYCDRCGYNLSVYRFAADFWPEVYRLALWHQNMGTWQDILDRMER